MFVTALLLPGVDGVLLTGGYYRLRFVRAAAGWCIQRLFEDNRWMQQVDSSAGSAVPRPDRP